MRRALLALCVIAALPGRAEAFSLWNPLRAAASKIAAAGRAIGGVLGAPAGGFIEAATAPTLNNLEGFRERLVDDLEGTLRSNLGKAGEVISGVADTTVARIDHTLAARILQVQTGLDQTIDGVLGRLEVDARKLLDDAARVGKALVQQIDQVAAKQLDHVDQILGSRVHDLERVVGSSIQQVDDIARKRLAELDDMTQRRLGNLDVIATKQSLGFEGMLIRLAALIAAVVLIAFVAWRLFRELADAIRDADQRGAPRLRAIGWRSLTRLAPQLALAGAGAAALFALADWLPRSSQKRAELQVASHSDALDDAVAALDVSRARYHESQLEILGTDIPAIAALTGHPIGTAAEPRRKALAPYHAKVQKAALLHTVFTRPGLLHTQQGLAELFAQVGEVEAAIGETDPDVMIAKAYILWQVGGSRDDEYDAAVLCAAALARGGNPRFTPLARNYVSLFLADPYTPRDAANLDALTGAVAATPDAPTGPFARVIELDRLITELDRASTAAYLDMLDAHVELRLALRRPDPRAASAARDQRTAAARRLIEAWAVFDAKLEANPLFASDAMVLSVFTLDDAVLTRAHYWAAMPGANELPPTLAKLAEDRSSTGALLRARIAPIRVAWDQRYGALLGPTEHEIVAYQETQRFAAFERRAAEFEQAYVAFAVDARTAAAPALLLASASRAATRAAGMGLYRDTPAGRIREAERILAAAAERGQHAARDTLDLVAQYYQIRRLRLL